MTDPRVGFLSAICAEPQDDTPRLIFADWLEEHGETDRANFIRLQCRAEQLPRGSDGRYKLLQQADSLLLRHEQEWLGAWSTRLVRWRFSRGFIHEATITANHFLSHGEELYRTEPIYRLGLVDDRGDPLAAEAVGDVVVHPAFANVRSLDILGATPASSEWFEWLGAGRICLLVTKPVGRLLLSRAAACRTSEVGASVPFNGILCVVLRPDGLRGYIESLQADHYAEIPKR